MKLTSKYILPIKGKILRKNPLKGDKKEHLGLIPLTELPNFPEYFDEGEGRNLRCDYSYSVLSYDIDNEACEIELTTDEVVHTWLTALLPQLDSIKTAKKWKLDKAEMVEE